MIDVAIEVGLVILAQDSLKGRELADLLGVEVGRLVEHKTVAVAEDVGREPTAESEVTHFQDWSKTTLDKRLSGLKVLTGDG